MNKVIQGPLPSYAVELLVQAKALLGTLGGPHEKYAEAQLERAVIKFEEQMPMTIDGAVWEAPPARKKPPRHS